MRTIAVEEHYRSNAFRAARALIAEIAPLLDGTPSEGVHTGLRHAHAVLAADRDAEAMFEAAMSADLSRWPFARARLFL